MGAIVTKGGMEVALVVLRRIYVCVGPWLREQAGKSDTPIDEWMLDLLEKVIDYKP